MDDLYSQMPRRRDGGPNDTELRLQDTLTAQYVAPFDDPHDGALYAKGTIPVSAAISILPRVVEGTVDLCNDADLIWAWNEDGSRLDVWEIDRALLEGLDGRRVRVTVEVLD